MTSIPVIIQHESGTETQGHARVRTFDRSERVKRAWKALGFCWGLALFSVALPILHFFLVPVLVIAGPIAAWVLLSRESRVDGGTGECPKCQAPFEIARGKPEWPLQDTCGKCHTHVVIRLADQPTSIQA